MTTIERRDALLWMAAAGSGLAVGCGTDGLGQKLDQRIAETPTDTLEHTRLALRGFQIVAFAVGKRIVHLPHPAVRVLGVTLLTSGAITFLVVEYLDVELRRRSHQEELDDGGRSLLESAMAVKFLTDNGLEETVMLGPNRYEPSEGER